MMLQQADAYADDVSYDKSLADDKYGKPEENLANVGVSRANGFEQSYHLCSLKDDNK